MPLGSKATAQPPHPPSVTDTFAHVLPATADLYPTCHASETLKMTASRWCFRSLLVCAGDGEA
jgi:hypothetical protein